MNDKKQSKNIYVQVLLPSIFNKAFDYSISADISIKKGQYVKVPFGKKSIYGVVWSKNKPETSLSKIKDIIEVPDITPMSQQLMDFIEWTANYTVSPIGSVLSMSISIKDLTPITKSENIYNLSDIFLGAEITKVKITKSREKVIDLLKSENNLNKDYIKRITGVSDSIISSMVQNDIIIKTTQEDIINIEPPIIPESLNIELSKEQELASNNLIEQIHSNSYSTTLLDGITGSGKTEVYSTAILEAIKSGKQALILLPEIILATQLNKRIIDRFGFEPTLWHSSLTPKKRKENWFSIVNGTAKLIVGARSALYLPYNNLGIIVVDEEHDQSFKQEEGVIYNGRDMAVTRAFIEKIPTVLVTASPSVETVYNVQCNKFNELKLHSRHGEAVLPNIQLVDMRCENLTASQWISEELKQEIKTRLEKNEQSLLFLNRRGYAPLTLCRKCGYRFQCQDCSSWMVEHRYPPSMQCHQCGHTQNVVKDCPECESEDSLAFCGPGVERLAEEVGLYFPDANIDIMTSDKINNAAQANKTISRIMDGVTNIIIGTQMVAKGHHFPNLTLVGVIDADLGLEGGDMRAAEKSFQLLQQVSGRAGREKVKGQAIIQSYMPESLVMDALQANDRDSFIKNELLIRKNAGVTPFGRMAAIVISNKDENMAQDYAKQIARTLPMNDNIRILGPTAATLYQLRGMYRYRILIITKKNINIQELIRTNIARVKIGHSTKIKIDIDPYSFN